MSFQDFFELNQLYARYASAISAGNWDQWPEFFTDDCLYRIQP
ncbi:MAG: salicylate hydroxylase, partial [Proteobacteria bacterium]|nr:salicylate hydroxylase [Pseudomonadota bacterium]